MRIVSLIPSATEIVCALGLEKDLVGRSHECDYPPSVEALPALTAPKIDPTQGTRDIDRDVRRLVELGLSVYRIDTERLEALAPDVVVTQDQCQVCAVSLDEVTAAVRGLTRRNVRVVSLQPLSFKDVLDDVRRVGEALGVPERAEAVCLEMSRRIEDLGRSANPVARPPRVVHVEWIAPLMVGGHWIAELVERAGGEHGLGDRDGRSHPIAWETARAYDPEVVIVAPCGFDIPQSEKDLPLLRALPGWQDVAAVRAGRVFLADGNAFFNRPGPRLVETAEIVQAALFGRRPGHRFPERALRQV
jgi:iron complex transport system substrate-binding protein